MNGKVPIWTKRKWLVLPCIWHCHSRIYSIIFVRQHRLPLHMVCLHCTSIDRTIYDAASMIQENSIIRKSTFLLWCTYSKQNCTNLFILLLINCIYIYTYIYIYINIYIYISIFAWTCYVFKYGVDSEADSTANDVDNKEIDGNRISKALEILQSCTKPLIYSKYIGRYPNGNVPEPKIYICCISRGNVQLAWYGK